MINKSIGDISEQDLQTLIAQKEVEGKTIEYKQELPRNTDADKKEFLADISSFSNSSGGDLIYGMVEDKGMPKTLDGLDIKDFDQVKQRLENLVRNGIEPRIPSLNIQPVPLSNTRTALVIRVPKSWSNPHRVRYQGHDKFYSRNSAGKYQLDVA
jgi:predicted HTH transcriptional regulator